MSLSTDSCDEHGETPCDEAQFNLLDISLPFGVSLSTRSLGHPTILDLPGHLKISTLDNDILSIFHKKLWTDKALYKIIMPALRLASMFLTHRDIAGFWHRACFGERTQLITREADTVTWNANKHVHVQDRKPWSETRQAEFSEFLQALSHRISYSFRGGMKRACGIITHHEKHMRHGQRIRVPDVHLCGAYRTAAQALAQGSSTDSDAALRFYLSFAVTLAHEVAHAVEREFQLGRPEAHHENHVWNEAGFAWESAVFGGEIWGVPANGEEAPDGKNGLYICKRDETGYSKGGAFLPMLWIWNLQQRQTWEAPFVSHFLGVFP